MAENDDKITDLQSEAEALAFKNSVEQESDALMKFLMGRNADVLVNIIVLHSAYQHAMKYLAQEQGHHEKINSLIEVMRADDEDKLDDLAKKVAAGYFPWKNRKLDDPGIG